MGTVAVVVALRRYPVKSLAGEALDHVRLDERGLEGDRWYAVVDEEGKLASAKDSRRFRRQDAVLAYRARTGDDGAVVVEGPGGTWRAGDVDLDARLSAETGRPQRVLPERAVAHQDGGSVSLVGTATLAWCAQRWGGDPDPRRFRVNLVVSTDEPFEEDGWVGRQVTVGSARLAVVERVPRCRTIDLAQDGVEPGAPWLRGLGAERDLKAAVYADVVLPGTVRIGDAVTLV